MFGLRSYFSKIISKEYFIEYLRAYIDRKVSKKEFFKCSRNCKIFISSYPCFLSKSSLNFRSYDFSGIDLSNFDIDLKFINFNPFELKFKYSNFTSTNLCFSKFKYIDFEGATFVKVKTFNSSFFMCNLKNIKLINSNSKLLEFDNIKINKENMDSIKVGTCSSLENNFLKVLKNLKNCVIIFLKRENLEIPIGILKFEGDKTFLLIQDIKINGNIYQKGICFMIERKILFKIGFVKYSKIYKLVLDEINLSTLRPISFEYIKNITKGINILLKKIENSKINFEEILDE